MELLLPINVVGCWVTHVPFYVLILRYSYERYSKVNFILSLFSFLFFSAHAYSLQQLRIANIHLAFERINVRSDFLQIFGLSTLLVSQYRTSSIQRNENYERIR